MTAPTSAAASASTAIPIMTRLDAAQTDQGHVHRTVNKATESSFAIFDVPSV